MLLVFLAPKAFTRAATEKIVEIRKIRHEGPFTDRHRAESEEFARIQTNALRRTFLVGISVTAVTLVAGIAAGWFLRRLVSPNKNAVYILQGFSAAIILGATLGQIGRKEESIGGQNLADEMNGFIFRALYVIGTFLFVLSVSWDAS